MEKVGFSVLRGTAGRGNANPLPPRVTKVSLIKQKLTLSCVRGAAGGPELPGPAGQPSIGGQPEERVGRGRGRPQERAFLHGEEQP